MKRRAASSGTALITLLFGLLDSLALLLPLATGCFQAAGGNENPPALSALDNFHAIAPNVAYRSAQLDAGTLRRVIEAYGIRTIVNLRGENPGVSWYDDEKALADELGVVLVSARWSANALPPRDELLRVFDAFQSAAYPILIHCEGGSDRTGAAAAIWRMEVDGDSRNAAAGELSAAYGHFAVLHPAMDQLVQMFQNDRNWILNEYPGPG